MTWIDNGNKVFSRTQDTRFQVRCPYSDAFVVSAHKIGGKWRKRTQMWSFPKETFGRATKALNEVYGTRIGMRRKAANDV